MCWQSNKYILKKTSKDLIVYKPMTDLVFKRDCIFFWRKNLVSALSLMLTKRYYSEKRNERINLNPKVYREGSNTQYILRKGYLSYIDVPSARCPGYKILKFVIPKGTYYCINKIGAIMSEKLQMCKQTENEINKLNNAYIK